MKILFADPDRDLLMTYGRLLELDGHEVSSAFDGVQAVNMIKSSTFDLAVINKNIPRVSSRDIIKMLNSSNIPSIVLLGRHVTPNLLLDYVAASSYLNFPFSPNELRERINEIAEKKEHCDMLEIENIEIETGKFRSTDGTCFTNEEIDILRWITKNEKFDIRQVSSYVNSINNKFGRLKKRSRIKYVLNEGYKLVKENE